MKYRVEDIMHIIKEEKVKSLRLAFCDVYGNEKNIAIMQDELEAAFKGGIPINASMVKDFGEGVATDLILHPELDTVSLVPWRPENDPVLRIFCSMTYPDGTPFVERGTKSLLIKAMQEAEKIGYEFYFGTSLKFYLFKLDENGNPTKIPADDATYLDIPPDDRCERMRRQICMGLEDMGLKPSNASHSFGPGQNEIEFGYSNPLVAGNNIVTLKGAIKNVAYNHGYYADFSPKPLKDLAGSGFHINISVRGEDGTDKGMETAVAGLLDKVADMTVFLNPTRESYDRIGKCGAPQYVSWTGENRPQLLRIPDVYGAYKKAVLNSPDALANPFLVFALIIFAGVHGVKNQLQLPEPADFDLDTASSEILMKYKRLPQSYEEACRVAKNSEFINSCISKDIIDIYTSK